VNVVNSRYLDLMTSWKLGATLFPYLNGFPDPFPNRGFPNHGVNHAEWRCPQFAAAEIDWLTV
jgi:hypothetical protein